MDKITADIIDYLGKYDNGVLVLLSLNHNGKFSEATIYYSDKVLALTVDESVEKKLNCPIELWHGYKDLVVSILKRVVPYNQIINRLDEISFVDYFTQNKQQSRRAENIDSSDINIAK